MEKERLIIAMDYIFTFDDHIKNPEISVSQYIQSKCIDLSQTVNVKKSGVFRYEILANY